MEEQYVTFETAELAYLKGLPIFLNSGNDLSCYEIKNKNFIYYHVHIDFPSKEKFLYAPTQSLLQKWLREEYNIIVWANPIRFGNYRDKNEKYIPSYIKYEYKLFMLNKSFNENTTNFYDRYEDALEIGLQESLKLI